MSTSLALGSAVVALLTLIAARRGWARLALSRAKHRSLAGHPRMALRLARLMPGYAYDDEEALASDGADAAVVARRRDAMARLERELRARAPLTLEQTAMLERGISDAAFVNHHRVPFQYQRFVQGRLEVGSVVTESDGARVRDLDGNWSYDVGGSYGVNLFGSDFYKRCIDAGVARARGLGLVLGAYHPIIADNVRRLQAVSGLDEVSFHMSGTEAVMQAVRLARYHTGRSHAVRFAGAYHGWSDGLQAGVGNPRPVAEVYTLAEQSERTLALLRSRRDIACVLVNPIQAMHPNRSPASDTTLVASDRTAHYDKEAYRAWLVALRAVCDERGIVLIFDEVFLGFRLAKGGVQEYFGVRADLVTYGKSLGGGLPVGVVCGRRALMRRFRDDRPADVCFARGTFNSHPYVMATMNEFLRHLDEPEVAASYADLDARWTARARVLEERLVSAGCPLAIANMTSVFTVLYRRPSRFNWMLQFYLRAEGISTAWIGTGRLIFPHDLTDGDFEEIVARFVRAASRMAADGWWSGPTLTNREIQRRVTRELASVWLSGGRGRGPSDRGAHPAADGAEPCGTS